jgi:hypothetical protein
MRIPQVTDRINADRIKEAPAHALRAVFAGIGQLLVVADKIRKQGDNRAAPPPATSPPAAPESESAAAPPVAAPPPAGPPSAAPPHARRSLDRTGNVRLLSAEDLADDPPAAETTPAAEATPVAQATPAAETTPAAEAAPIEPPPAESIPAEPLPADPIPAGPIPAEAAPSAAAAADDAALPVPNYDSLSLPSLRARLRTLNTAQLRELIEYEQSHAARADVVAMFERRIAKLAANG